MSKTAADHGNNTVIDAKEAIFTKIKAENEELRDNLAEIYDIIQDNEKRQHNYNRVEDTIFAAESLDGLMHGFRRDLREIFTIPVAAVALLDHIREKSCLGQEGDRPAAEQENGKTATLFGTITGQLYQEFFTRPEPLVAASLPPALAAVFARGQEKPMIASLVCLPLVVGQRHLGVLLLASDDPDKFTPEKGTDFICRLGTRLAVAIENLLIRRQLETASRLDQLTGLYNRRTLNELLPLEFARARRYRLPLATHGHVAGDAILARVGKILQENTRINDTAIRYGGDEFLVIMPHTDARQAAVVAAKILGMVKETMVSLPDGSQVGTAVSIGVGSYPAPGIEDEKGLLEIADQDLYRAKQAGKGRVGA
ncbi:MAG: sensor domain-containing diguanylate cyclase [Deltaproteobacteria bacterium]|nr:sensor domain-containing diguanylate cyclase [Deltaproteobacteria bacterium]